MSFYLECYSNGEGILKTIIESAEIGRKYLYSGDPDYTVSGLTNSVVFTAVLEEGYSSVKWLYHLGSIGVKAKELKSEEFTYDGSSGNLYIKAVGIADENEDEVGSGTAQAYIFDGESWVRVTPYIYNGTSWVEYSPVIL